ncbi:putative secreted protein (Por secretion system target) [Winogradskyella pacifica]|uniref:Putative secreted protein (Por secretion system target) n=1 Tax=Winogradskyella pacifica TaxID=664642 RepID=A0A3D9N477_9FLAO|nr:T9SS type A sorting domain-containing protein [Winogradskyella pacifica]REE24861.1 putative secreted protein (Por secretion system target) [Winogradskyella pacifica]
MKTSTCIILLLLPFFALSQITLNQTDNFEDYTTKNWTKGDNSVLPNQNILTDGPDGTDDKFLRVQSNGGNGADSKLVTFNNAQWQGDYNAAGVTYISMDVRNSGSEIILLRLAFEGFSTSRRYSSTNPIAVIPGQGWQTIVFPIDANSLTNITTSGLGYNSTFDDVREFRILHNDVPSWDGDPIEALLDIDNITARNDDMGLADLGEPKIALNLIDDFEGVTTENWTKGDNSTLPNQNILTDGPDGVDDNFLRVESNGGNGADSKLVTFNNAQWRGDYNAAGVTYISMDVRNSGSEIMLLRLAFEGFSTSRRYSSTNPIAVIPGQGWQTIVFPIDANSLTNITTSGLGYNSTFDDVREFRILHNDVPSWDGDPIEAILDIDNMQARNDDMGLADLGEPKISLNLIDDFEGVTTENWTKGDNSTLPNQNILTDGPDGADDNFLRVQSNGGNDADSKLVTFNNAQWEGDYNAAGVTYISMDVRNSGSSIIILRLAFEGFSTSRRWSSTNPIAVIPGQGWQTIVFPIDENSLTNITTSGLGYNSTFDDVKGFRILHNDTPSWDGDPIEATLDIDNIQARNETLSIVTIEEPTQQIKVYPNPSTDFIQVNGMSEEFEYSIFDITGKEVMKGQSKNQNRVDISNLVKGTYFINIESYSTFKFLKN